MTITASQSQTPRRGDGAAASTAGSRRARPAGDETIFPEHRKVVVGQSGLGVSGKHFQPVARVEQEVDADGRLQDPHVRHGNRRVVAVLDLHEDGAGSGSRAVDRHPHDRRRLAGPAFPAGRAEHARPDDAALIAQLLAHGELAREVVGSVCRKLDGIGRSERSRVTETEDGHRPLRRDLRAGPQAVLVRSPLDEKRHLPILSVDDPETRETLGCRRDRGMRGRRRRKNDGLPAFPLLDFAQSDARAARGQADRRPSPPRPLRATLPAMAARSSPRGRARDRIAERVRRRIRRAAARLPLPGARNRKTRPRTTAVTARLPSAGSIPVVDFDFELAARDPGRGQIERRRAVGRARQQSLRHEPAKHLVAEEDAFVDPHPAGKGRGLRLEPQCRDVEIGRGQHGGIHRLPGRVRGENAERKVALRERAIRGARAPA